MPFHMDVGHLIGLAATVVGTWLGSRIIRPRDHERAQALDRIARGAAAIAISLYPDKKWAELLQSVVQLISSAAGIPTTNKDAIERAAAAALFDLHKAPGS